VKLSTELQLVSRLGMSTVVPLLPDMLSWREHWQLEFYYIIMPELLSHSWTNSSYYSSIKSLFHQQKLVSVRIFMQHLIHCYCSTKNKSQIYVNLTLISTCYPANWTDAYICCWGPDPVTVISAAHTCITRNLTNSV